MSRQYTSGIGTTTVTYTGIPAVPQPEERLPDAELRRRLQNLSADISECRRESRDKGHLLILLMLFCLCVGWCP
jgi:hypothetical protein